MSVTVDANVLIYAANSRAPEYETANELIRRLGRGPDLVYLFWPTAMAFLRIATHPRILSRPLSPADAEGLLDLLLSRPHVRSPGEEAGFWGLYRKTGGAPRGTQVPDAHLAALMRQHGVRLIYTRDRDFRRFDGIEMRDPFA